jgi:N6-adenosine-specific RNA methylase IME4
VSDRYRTIVADPPWRMARCGGYSWRAGLLSGERIALDYPTMTNGQIAALPVADMADPAESHLFVWTTHRHLEATFGIVRAWGFAYVCTLTWCKPPHGWGPGGAFQSTTEFVLYARRGRSSVESQIDRQWWTWPRGEHSAKPDAFLDLVESRFPAPRVELFSRRARLGWDYRWHDGDPAPVAAAGVS